MTIHPEIFNNGLKAFIGGPELLIIAIVGILIFGSKFPNVIRELGKFWFKLRRNVNDIKREVGLEQTLDELRQDADPFAPENNDSKNNFNEE
jgi:Sec-independent protein translocase protein TatA|tara:strand:+ start:1125 stop:1400 length:276 start_codon:yes stop_codon:yes gene_type:complete